jgi:hypothetical protein
VSIVVHNDALGASNAKAMVVNGVSPRGFPQVAEKEKSALICVCVNCVLLNFNTFLWMSF